MNTTTFSTLGKPVLVNGLKVTLHGHDRSNLRSRTIIARRTTSNDCRFQVVDCRTGDVSQTGFVSNNLDYIIEIEGAYYLAHFLFAENRPWYSAVVAEIIKNYK